MSIVIQEIMQNKIELDMSGNLQTREATEHEEGGTVDLTQSSEKSRRRATAKNPAMRTIAPGRC